MEGVIDHRLWPRGLVVFLDDLAQRLAAMLRGKRDHRGGAAKGGGDGGAVEIVGADHSGGGALLDMAVAVDAARQYQPPAGVDLPCPRTQPFAERRDDAVLYPDVADRRIGRRRHRAVADHQIVLAHPPSAFQPLSALQGEREGPVAQRREGEVGRVTVRTSGSPTSPRPSPPPGRRGGYFRSAALAISKTPLLPIAGQALL